MRRSSRNANRLASARPRLERLEDLLYPGDTVGLHVYALGLPLAGLASWGQPQHAAEIPGPTNKRYAPPPLV
jgi:hypothetical protein